MSSKRALIGVFDPNVAWYAAIQEFGNLSKPTIPERSFLRSTIVYSSDASREWVADNADVLVGSMLQNDINSALQAIGDRWADYVVQFIDKRGAGTWAPLAAYTIAKKGHDIPLIDSGMLRGAIKCEVW
jgi:hypothetical protein